jgi:uncharacterized membrane protein (DUF4010 family)
MIENGWLDGLLVYILNLNIAALYMAVRITNIEDSPVGRTLTDMSIASWARLIQDDATFRVRDFFARFGGEELGAFLKFLSLLGVLAVLPNRELDFFFGLNLQMIWLFVVFMAGVGFTGYILSKLVDPTIAIGITGVIGGCVSPGLAIMSLIEQTRRHRAFDLAYALAAAIASTIAFPRMLVIVSILSPELALSLVAPFAAMTSISVLVTTLLWFRTRAYDSPGIKLKTSFRVRPALALGAIVALGLIAIDVFSLPLLTAVARSGVVLVVLMDLLIHAGISWVAGAKKMAGVIALILVCSAIVGLTLIAVTV